MDILIGQKRKSQNKKPDQKQSQDKKQDKQDKQDKQETQDKEDTQEPQDKQEPKKEFKHVPINPSKVIYLDDFAYIEQVDHRMRLVTHDCEMYY